jgi:hypothetical protein
MEELYKNQFDEILKELFIKKFYQNNFEIINKVIMFLNNAGYMFDSSDLNRISTIIQHELYPNFAAVLIPYETRGNGDCLWNMISLGLVGTDKLARFLRLLTAFCMLLMKENFIRLIKEQYESTKTDNALALATINFQEYLRIALDNEQWGNSYHLIALSTALGKHLYIYSFFKSNNKFLLNKTIGIKALDKHFKGFGDSKIGHHLRYEPLLNRTFPKLNDNILYGFYDGRHYTALIPKKKIKIEIFRPVNSFTNASS